MGSVFDGGAIKVSEKNDPPVFKHAYASETYVVDTNTGLSLSDPILTYVDLSRIDGEIDRIRLYQTCNTGGLDIQVISLTKETIKRLYDVVFATE